MSQFPLGATVGQQPRVFDSERAERGIEELSAALAASDHRRERELAAIIGEPPRRALFAALFGNSPFLDRCLLNEPAWAAALCVETPEVLLARLLSEVREAAHSQAADLMPRLRIARRRLALLTAAADIAGYWGLAEVTGALSDFAEAALHAALAHLLCKAAAAGDLELVDPADPERGCGLVVLAMGKLGARELNYSSDIDLIVLYDPEVARYVGDRSLQDCFVGLTRALVRLLQERTGEGYVCRTDLRLRPDAGATPLAMSVAAAEAYYESVGQNWERAALIKARVVAGDGAVGEAFLAGLAPFVWRKHLDFAAIADIHSIKRQIAAHRGHQTIAVAGHNIKLGRGGIREIEFFAQTQQLIAGGREPALRAPATCDAIAALARGGRITAIAADEMTAAYHFLRRLEHRLQMVADEQTHALPTTESALYHMALFTGHDDATRFADEVLVHLRRVERHYAALFEHAPPLGGPGNLVFTGTEDDPDTLATLDGLGFREPATIAASIRTWHHGRYRAVRTARARELLTDLVPAILEAMAKTLNPDGAFLRFDEFLARLPAGVPLFSLFRAHPGLLDLVAEIMGSAPRLAEYLSHDPALLDGVLGTDIAAPLAPLGERTSDLEQRLDLARDYQDVLDLTRRWAHEQRFQVGVRMLLRRYTAVEAGPALANIAEAVLGALLPRVEAEFAERHGRIPQAALAIIAMGKLGAREMTEGSDLDLIFLYDNPAEATASDGPQPLAPSQFFARLSQRYINALTALTAEGGLYEIDMRLRPSGSAGPIAALIDGFAAYQCGSAWTWEHLALTRARVIAAPPVVRDKIETILREALVTSRDPDTLLADVHDMRERMTREHRSDDPWDIKHARGGLVDLEFLCEYLQLRHAAEHPSVLSQDTDEALQRLGAAGVLPARTVGELATAAGILRNAHGLLRLCLSAPISESGVPDGLTALLTRAVGGADAAALQPTLLEAEAGIRNHYEHLVAAPAIALRRTEAQA